MRADGARCDKAARGVLKRARLVRDQCLESRPPTASAGSDRWVLTPNAPTVQSMIVLARQTSLEDIDVCAAARKPETEEVTPQEQAFERFRKKIDARVLVALGDGVPEMKAISLRDSASVNRTNLRAIAVSAGERLCSLNLAGSSLDDDGCTILGMFSHLQEVDLSSTHISDGSLQFLVEGSYRTLRKLSLACCPRLSDVAVEWIAGFCGYAKKPCRRLRSLDLGSCSRMGDRALAALARGCRRLAYLNLELLPRISDKGIQQLTAGCRELQVLSCRRISKLTDRALVCIGARCKHIRSLCFNRCSNLSDAGIMAIGKGCPRLECISITGCSKVSERGICAIASGCRNLIALNVSGCERVTERGLEHLCRGNGFLEPARLFIGLKPRRDCSWLKVRMQESAILQAAASKIQSAFRAKKGRERFRQQFFYHRIQPSATKLQQAWRRARSRKAFYDFFRRGRERRKAATKIQRRYRQRYVVIKAIRDAAAALKAARIHEVTCMFQAMWRGKLARRRYPCREVPDYFEMKRLRMIRQRRDNAARLLQRQWKGKYDRLRLAGMLEELNQRRRDVAAAVLSLQCGWRCCVARAELTRLRREWAARMALELRASGLLQRVWRGVRGRKIAYEKRRQREMVYLVKVATAIKLQGIYRGWKRRRQLVDEFIRETRAATKIQARFRCFNTPNYAIQATMMAKDRIRFNSQLEARDRAIDAARTREDFRESQMHDSASEEEETDDWEEFWSEEKDRPYWFSAKLKRFVYDDPWGRPFELSLVGRRCRVRWPRGLDERVRFDEWGNKLPPKYPVKPGEPEVWYEGFIQRYNCDKDKHRIYFTGDLQRLRPSDVVYNREWVRLKEQPHRVQIEQPTEDGSGEAFFVLYHVLAMEERRRRREQLEQVRREHHGVAGPEEDEVRADAAAPAGKDDDWELYTDDESGCKYWYSPTTGESVWADLEA